MPSANSVKRQHLIRELAELTHAASVLSDLAEHFIVERDDEEIQNSPGNNGYLMEGLNKANGLLNRRARNLTEELRAIEEGGSHGR